MSGADGSRRVALRIHGQVQGVFYRRAAQKEASRLGLSGFVRNESDGSVYAEAQGASAPLENFLRWCRRGPPAARVDTVVAEELPEHANENGFQVRHAG